MALDIKDRISIHAGIADLCNGATYPEFSWPARLRDENLPEMSAR